MTRVLLLRRSLAVAALCVSLAATALADEPKLATESYMIPSADAGIQLYIRNKHPAGVTTFRWGQDPSLRPWRHLPVRDRI